MQTAKKWSIGVLIIVAVMLVLLGGLVAVIDPFFHYHKPLPFLEYPMFASMQRYQTDGIVKHFDYDAIIAGSSITENFRASELDALFDVSTVKVSMSGSSFKETCDLLRRAARANPDLRIVVRSLDMNYLLMDIDYVMNNSQPDYLYDMNLMNDVRYLLNNTVLLDQVLPVLTYTYTGGKTPDFDEYSSWWKEYTFSRESALKGFVREARQEQMAPFTPEMERDVRDNMIQNFVSLALEYPDIQFYCFYPPYSAIWWDNVRQMGNLDKYILAMETAADTLLECDNIHLFSFADDYDTVLNLDKYKDYIHYSPDINSKILRCMKDGTGRLTRQNNAAYWQNLRGFMIDFDFATYLAEQGYTGPMGG